jgi:hypothetical protein
MKPQTLLSFVGVFAFVFCVPTSLSAFAQNTLPTSYTALNDYVIAAPNQGQVDTCLFMASTGAMEILLNKFLGIHNAQPNGDTDISERYTISAPDSARAKVWFENAFLKFDSGEAIINRDLPFESFTGDGEINYGVWGMPMEFSTAPRISLPKIDTVLLFASADQYARGILGQDSVDQVKQALLTYQSPIITVGNDEDYWHVVVIVGYDDQKTGDCYELDSSVCIGKVGGFYVRDSFGTRLDFRSYEWFMRHQNSATVAILAN